MYSSVFVLSWKKEKEKKDFQFSFLHSRRWFLMRYWEIVTLKIAFFPEYKIYYVIKFHLRFKKKNKRFKSLPLIRPSP